MQLSIKLLDFNPKLGIFPPFPDEMRNDCDIDHLNLSCYDMRSKINNNKD
jgi:hypothetical protein